MNFLQLVQRLHQESRSSGSAPVTLVNQGAETRRLISWINTAWMDIQSAREDWDWMRADCSFPTVSGKAIYTAQEIGLTDWGNWTRDMWRNYPTVDGNRAEIFMSYLDYKTWLDVYQFGATRYTLTRPVQLTITPNKSIGLGPPPTDTYTVTGQYFRVPTEMTDNADEPAMPARFHLAIVYRALMFYGVSEAAPESYQYGLAEFNRLFARLELNQLPEVLGADALQV